MLTVLGDLLRAVLRNDSQPETSLSEEIDLTRSYVALEQMRFGDRLQVTFDIADGVQQALVPSFLMQPLLENAIIHGLRGVRKTGIIAVRAAEEDRRPRDHRHGQRHRSPRRREPDEDRSRAGVHLRTPHQDVCRAARVLDPPAARGRNRGPDYATIAVRELSPGYQRA